jgi:pimeloyl-ACP methyl ester carboxylesterase
MRALGPRAGRVLAVAAVVAIIGGALAINAARRAEGEAAQQRTDSAFYTLPAPVAPGSPGELIRSERIAGAPFGTTAWRIVYHSRDLAGRDIPVSGVVIVPSGPAPLGGRTVVAWAHPTTGAAQNCAPSLDLDPFRLIEGLHGFLTAGFAVAATDYPGMGVAGDSSYLLGVPESNSVLDSVRAAEHIPDAHASSTVVLWGHSQGGQAALFAAQRAPEYAPELKIRGVAVAAPAAKLGTLMTDDIINVSGVTIASYAVPAYEAAYAGRASSAEIGGILTPAGAAATPAMARLCLLSQNAQIHAIADPLIGNYVRTDPATTEPWRTLLDENSAGGSPIRVPIFIGQGLADKLVAPSATRDYVAELCARGEDVSFHEFAGVGHALAAYASLPALTVWLTELVAGRPPSTC